MSAQIINIPNSMTVLPELLPYSIEMVRARSPARPPNNKNIDVTHNGMGWSTASTSSLAGILWVWPWQVFFA